MLPSEYVDVRDAFFSILALNFGGLNYILFHISLFLLCLNIARHRRNENAVAQVAYTYGGSTLAGLLIGVWPFIFTNKLALPTHIVARAAVYIMPAEVFKLFPVDCILNVGMELCRCVIATTWYAHTERVLGNGLGLESVIIGTVAGTFGAVLGSLSLQPIRSVATVSLFFAMLMYRFYFNHGSLQEENTARAFIVLWMMFAQYLLPWDLMKTSQARRRLTPRVKAE